MMRLILRLAFAALCASLVDAQCNPSPCGVNTNCQVSEKNILDPNTKQEISIAKYYLALLSIAEYC